MVEHQPRDQFPPRSLLLLLVVVVSIILLFVIALDLAPIPSWRYFPAFAGSSSVAWALPPPNPNLTKPQTLPLHKLTRRHRRLHPAAPCVHPTKCRSPSRIRYPRISVQKTPCIEGKRRRRTSTAMAKFLHPAFTLQPLRKLHRPVTRQLWISIDEASLPQLSFTGLQVFRLVRLVFQPPPPPFPIIAGGRIEKTIRDPTWVSPASQSPPLSCILLLLMLLLCLCPTLSRPLDPGGAEEAPGLPVPLEARKKASAYACIGRLLRSKYHLEVRDTTLTLMVHQ